MTKQPSIHTRSGLFTPATRPERFAKASQAGADVVRHGSIRSEHGLLDLKLALPRALAGGTMRPIPNNSCVQYRNAGDRDRRVSLQGTPYR